MSSPILPSLQIARLLLRKGDLHESRLAAEDACLDSLILDDRVQWLEASTIFFQCCHELEELDAAQIPMEQVVQFLKSSNDVALQARCETLLSSWLLAQGKLEEAQSCVQSAMSKAMDSQDLQILARALSVQILASSFDAKNDGRTIEQLNKLDVILTEVENSDIHLTAKLLRGYIYTRKGQYDLATPLLWSCYEQAKLHGFNLTTSSCLAQLARLYRDQRQEDEYRLYADLALRGVDNSKTPRLYKLIIQVCPPDISNRKALYDFQIDERGRKVREKAKGSIDFKNQHILFEMALLFIKHPGTRYTKEDLAQEIWNQAYEPDLHDNLIYVSIKRLRTLLEPDLESPRYILRDRKGYYFNPQSLVQFKNAEEATI